MTDEVRVLVKKHRRASYVPTEAEITAQKQKMWDRLNDAERQKWVHTHVHECVFLS